MKKIFILIITLMSMYTIDAYAATCKGSDGCVGCTNSNEISACKSSSAYKEWKSSNGGTSSSGSGSESGTGTSGTYNNSASSGSQTTGTSTATITGEVEDTTELNCDSLFGTNTAVGKYVHDIYNIMKFLVPILLLALSIKDFGSGIISQDEGAIKKAINTFWKRLIIAIVILVLPTILNYFLKLLGVDTCFL